MEGSGLFDKNIKYSYNIVTVKKGIEKIWWDRIILEVY